MYLFYFMCSGLHGLEVRTGHVNIEYCAAFLAVEMMMRGPFGFITGTIVRDAYLVRFLQFDQTFDRIIYRRQGYALELVPQGVVYLFNGRMDASAFQVFEYGDPLRCRLDVLFMQSFNGPRVCHID